MTFYKKGLFGQMSADIKKGLIEISRREGLNRVSRISSIAVSTLANREKDSNNDKRGLALSVIQMP